MTANHLLDQLRAMGADPPAAPALPALRPCAGGMPGQPCAARVDRRAPDGLCAACLEARAAARRRAAAAAAERELLDALPELHRNVTFGSPELATWCRDAAAVARAQALTEAWPPSLRTVLFTGPTSVGKSTLVAAVVRALKAGRRRRATVQWVDVRAIAGARHLGIDSAPLVRRAIGADIAVFDDLAKEQHALEYEVQTMIGALEFRHARLPDLVPDQAITLITTEREVRADGGGGSDGRDLLSCYRLSFVRRIAGEWDGQGDVARGSAAVIPVRRGS